MGVNCSSTHYGFINRASGTRDAGEVLEAPPGRADADEAASVARVRVLCQRNHGASRALIIIAVLLLALFADVVARTRPT